MIGSPCEKSLRSDISIKDLARKTPRIEIHIELLKQLEKGKCKT